MRISLRRMLVGLETWWRLTEADGELCCRWLPNECPSDPLDHGGFSDYADAVGFGLAIDRERALAGLLGDLTPQDIDRERAGLDRERRGRPPPSPELPWFEAA